MDGTNSNTNLHSADPTVQDPGAALLAAGHPELALPHLSHSTSVSGLINLGICLRQLDKLEDAMDLVDRLSHTDAVSRAPYWNLLGMLQTDYGRFHPAMTCYQKAKSCLKKSDPVPYRQQVYQNYGTSLMRLGRFPEAWPFWETGRINASWSPIPATHPWGGESGTVAIFSEGGYGDAFLFSRFLHWATALADCKFYLWPRLTTFRDWGLPAFPLDSPFSPGCVDFSTSLLSLPAVCGLQDWSSIPSGQWEQAAPPSTRSGIGICWKAEENSVRRKHRSIPPLELEELRCAVESTFPSTPLLSLVPGPCPTWMTPLLAPSWESSASLIRRLDRVITVDTAVAHLAGSLGIPTTVLLPIRSDWKWGTQSDQGSQSPWHPNVSLIRNTDPRSWLPAIQELRRSLR